MEHDRVGEKRMSGSGMEALKAVPFLHLNERIILEKRSWLPVAWKWRSLHIIIAMTLM